MDAQTSTLTYVLDAVARGDRRAAPEVLPLVYEELRTLAHWWMRKLPPGQMIQATDLVHEAYLRLLRTCDPGWDGKAHFFAAAARAMREILIEQARRKASAKHGGGRKQVAPRELAIAIEVPADDLLDLDEALQRLERDNTRAHQIVMLRFFAGLNTAETAGVLSVSVPTIERSWRYARAWLHSALTEGEGDGIKDP